VVQTKVVGCVLTLAVLAIMAVRQGHELKNEAYKRHCLLTQIEHIHKDRLNAVTAYNRARGATLLAKRARSMQIALVHPVEGVVPLSPLDTTSGTQLAKQTRQFKPVEVAQR